MKQTVATGKSWKILTFGIMAIFLLLPFHAFFTTWLGSNFGHLDVWRIWKELLMTAMVPLVLWLVHRDPHLKKWIRNDKLVLLSFLYVFLHVLLGLGALFRAQVNAEALIYSLLINLRFPIFLLICLVVSARTNIKKHWKKLLLGSAIAVIIFGLLQQFVLPVDFLRHFGYGQQTIPAFQTVDQKLEYRRLQSTLRGANPLGAYLLVVLTALTALLLSVKKSSQKKPNHTTYYLLLTIAAFLLLFFTYSRSAWLGTLGSGVLIVFWHVRSIKLRRWGLTAGVTVILLASGSLWLLRDNDRLQNTFFHSDETSQSAESSNAGRARALESGLRDVINQPLGRGPGTAGPASVRNDHPPRIAENYYIQIAQEVGVIGLGLFVAINVLVAQALWRQRTDTLSLILLASLAGITLINMLSHAWTDDTLSLIWWGLAGLALSPGILKDKHEEKAEV